jgi:protein-S-isoprenylcysteine O-methyltransferase Ste14
VHPAHDGIPRGLHLLFWLAWGLYWLISARDAKKTVRREAWPQRLIYLLPMLFVAPLFFWDALGAGLAQRMTAHPLAMYWFGTAILAAGLLFSVWARRTLGRNWSGMVTVKQDHELVQSGPYRFVRHPIYTGLLVALGGSAISWNRWFGVYLLVVLFVSFWIKLQREEAFMRETFGEKYDAYCARTKRLVPFVW